ncbi:hypothetical protein H9649_07280 [Sporosarcina sp. Sa2YVA2]|uniref:DUF3955 domain-containing protein n=1 Tax=Sporosarcina quadrami TaxID=2762234 RepID=A0ABR8U8L7_9BACL|nr:hypothetical protein [Sporosarcina quadrami]MBD7984376.1 hypothetical protein [Sporosarcina quadrami]
MFQNKDPNYKKYFWKRFFILFIPIFTIGVISEPYISNNPFLELEDYGSFIFFSLFYALILGGISALIVSFAWRLKLSKQ